MESGVYHRPVMVSEVMEYLVTDPSGTYVDGTLGGGGHSSALLEKYPALRIIGVDCDEAALAAARERLKPFGDRAALVRENFSGMAAPAQTLRPEGVNGVLLDLGVSSRQFDDLSRGFSFDSPNLDMRMDGRLPRSAEDLVNTADEKDLADIIYRYGEETRSRPISRAIVEARKKGRITSGAALAAVVERAKHRTGKTHPATRVFQALRIAVNGELENLQAFLDSAPGMLVSGGRVVIISYHSLEDRIVKQDFRNKGIEGTYRVLTKKVVFAAEGEVRDNPRSRSARLRCAEKI